MKYKMIVLDLDGTLTNSKKEITAHTKSVLQEAQEEGSKSYSHRADRSTVFYQLQNN